MYLFEGKYIDINNDEEIIRKIGFEMEDMKYETECCMYAINIANCLKKENECLVGVKYETEVML